MCRTVCFGLLPVLLLPTWLLTNPFLPTFTTKPYQVRIFIKFDRAEAATRALVDLQGRFFAGRQVMGGIHMDVSCCVMLCCVAMCFFAVFVVLAGWLCWPALVFVHSTVTYVRPFLRHLHLCQPSTRL